MDQVKPGGPSDAKRAKLDLNESNSTAKKQPLDTEELSQNGQKEVKETTIEIDNSDSVAESLVTNKTVIETQDNTKSDTTEPLEGVEVSSEEKTNLVKETTSDVVDGSEAESYLTEEAVGIKQYISQHEGFQGVIKQRYSDFMVNEISLDGRVVELTNTDLPPPDSSGNIQPKKIDTDVISPDDIKQLEELAESKDKRKSVFIEVGDDKAKRTRIHRAIAEGFPGLLDSTTVEKDGKKFVQVKLTENKDNGLRRWPKDRGDYCKFVLYKENKDTMDTVGLLGKQLRLKGSMFQYAGTKDKRAKTTQEVTVYRVQAEKLLSNNERLRNIVTGNFSYTKQPLKLGQLQGNKFTIILRSVTGSNNQIDEAMTSLRDVGFINYYGMQRFGTSSIPTHHIGKAILLSDWKTAVELILKPRAGDGDDVAAARNHWWTTRDSVEALHKMPRYQFIERALLEGLMKSGENNFVTALNKISRNTRLMYVHSYQSYIWNTVSSERISKYGIKPRVGDLAIKGDLPDKDGDHDTSSKSKVEPVVITDSNIGDYTIYDIVLPLPGYDVVYPDSSADLYKTLMAKDGLDYQQMRHKVKDFSLSGAYRHVMIKPTNVKWSTYRYNDVSLPLTLSDVDKMKGEEEPKSIEDGNHVALKMELSLPPSCYATMAIREVLKTDTSSAHQSTLNVT